MMKVKYIVLLILFTTAGLSRATAQATARAVKQPTAQTTTQAIAPQDGAATREESKNKKAWEFGLGGSVFQFNRVSFSNFTKLDNGGYNFDLSLKHPVYAGNIYIARELNSHFYLDLQGSAGFAKQELGNKSENKWLYTAELGLQWRLGEYFNSKYIDPYLRVGGGYMHKEFDILYSGTEGASSEEMKWIMENFDNKDGKDRKDLIPVSMGIGVNLWLNNHWGIGIQGDYVLMPYKDVANSLQGTARIMYRLGGKSKKTKSVISYVDRPVEVERVVERVVEKIVEIPGKEKTLLSLFNNIHFDFDKATITTESEQTLDRVAEILKENTGEHFLISGFTDIRGSQQYNQKLSEQRAKAVVDALTKRGVSQNILKSRGIGSRAAIAKMSASDQVRRGDRKVTIEIITNQDYWNYLEKAGY